MYMITYEPLLKCLVISLCFRLYCMLSLILLVHMLVCTFLMVVKIPEKREGLRPNTQKDEPRNFNIFIQYTHVQSKNHGSRFCRKHHLQRQREFEHCWRDQETGATVWSRRPVVPRTEPSGSVDQGGRRQTRLDLHDEPTQPSRRQTFTSSCHRRGS